MITNFSSPGADRNPQKLREYCQQISEDHPEAIVLGQMLFGQFANVEVIRDGRTDSYRITRTHIESTSLGGYWLAGKFRLFSPTEMALLESDCSCNLQKGTEYEGHHHPECDEFDGHN